MSLDIWGATTILSNARQPEVDFLHPSAVIFNKFWASRLSKSKDTEQYKFGSVNEYRPC